MPDTVMLLADSPDHPRLVRAYQLERDGPVYRRRHLAYAIEDQFGWAIVARQGRYLATVARYTPWPSEVSRSVRAAALTGLIRIATDMAAGEPT